MEILVGFLGVLLAFALLFAVAMLFKRKPKAAKEKVLTKSKPKDLLEELAALERDFSKYIDETAKKAEKMRKDERYYGIVQEPEHWLDKAERQLEKAEKKIQESERRLRRIEMGLPRPNDPILYNMTKMTEEILKNAGIQVFEEEPKRKPFRRGPRP